MHLTQFSAPGNLTDFTTDAQRKAWSKSVDELFGEVMAATTPCIPKSELQFVNPLHTDTSAFTNSEISWSGFPNALVASGLSREEAFKVADKPIVAHNGNLNDGRFVQDEYLEWFVHREGADIVAIEFTTETEHYWEQLYAIDAELTAQLYSELTGLAVKSSDIGKNKKYDGLNAFNTSKGIIHLIHPSNTLGAELDIACQSTRARLDASGNPTTDVVDCSRCGGSMIGGDTRNSDPKIASTVSAVAGQGRALTIPDPVGLYIARLDTTGWKTPDGSDPAACWKIVRGNPAVRARFEVPGRKFKISEITIAGEPITFAGQIAEQVFVKLTAATGPAGAFKKRPTSPCAGGAQQAAAAVPAHFTRSRRVR
jgi:hypothetical protein